jgi:hypothetical protein
MQMDRRVELAIGIDVFAVVLFVAIGRRTHDEGSAFAGVIKTAFPFLIGLAVAWAAGRAWTRPTSVSTGLLVWPITVLVGMIVRRTAFDGGTAASFVVVTTLFLGACLVGWRLVYRLLEQRSSRASRQGQVSGGSLIER